MTKKEDARAVRQQLAELGIKVSEELLVKYYFVEQMCMQLGFRLKTATPKALPTDLKDLVSGEQVAESYRKCAAADVVLSIGPTVSGDILVEERYGYRKAEGRSVLFTVPAPLGLEHALAEQVNQGHQGTNHTVFKCQSEGEGYVYYLWFHDGMMSLCLNMRLVADQG